MAGGLVFTQVQAGSIPVRATKSYFVGNMEGAGVGSPRRLEICSDLGIGQGFDASTFLHG